MWREKKNFVVQNLEPVSFNINRSLVNQFTTEINLSNNAKNLDLNWNLNTFPLVQVYRLKNPENAILTLFQRCIGLHRPYFNK